MDIAITQLEKPYVKDLPLMEDFYSIQGEGFYQGSAAYFIRLGGCNVKCTWCDVKESWEEHVHPQISVASMVARAKASGSKIVVVTGGEPTMHNLTALTHQLKQTDLKTHIETSGVYPLTGKWDWICFSPKKFKTPHISTAALANELKIVIFHKSDFEWAEQFAYQVSANCHLFLQPEWSREKDVLPLIVEYVKANPKWKISLQTHKHMGIL